VRTGNRSKKRNKRGIYILPNLFTSCSLFGGVYAIIAAIQDRYDAAAIAILIAAIFDWLDGKIARFTNTTSQFGVEFDSLSDLVGVVTETIWKIWLASSLFVHHLRCLEARQVQYPKRQS